MAALGAGGLIAWSAPAAFACDGDDHCYAVSIATKADLAVYGALYVTCNYVPNNGTIVTNEIWDSSTDDQYWTEVGIFTGEGLNEGSYYSKQWFWADQRPNGGGYNEWYVSGTPSTNTAYASELEWAGNNTWDVFGGNSGNLVGQSTAQPLTTSGVMEAGTEYSAASGTGMRNVGQVQNLQYESIQNQWASWGTLGKADPSDSGPGAYITPAYASGSSTTSWNGPC